MISSEEEFELLVKKWRDEGTQLFIMGAMYPAHLHGGGPWQFVFALKGFVVTQSPEEAEPKTFTVRAEEGLPLAVINYSNCRFIYETFATEDEEFRNMMQRTREDVCGKDAKYDLSVGLLSPGGGTLTIFTIERH